jgi:hypothetical protein
MTATSTRMYTILDTEFDIDELKDIATYGMSGGVGGFIYYHETTKAFDDNDDEIQDYLSDWVHDNKPGYDNEGSFAYFGRECEDITQLKNKLVWAYVELKASEILMENGIDY